MASDPDNTTPTPKPAQPRRRWYQFTLRTAGVWIALFCILLGSFAWWRDRAERQRKVVEELRGLGAQVECWYFSLNKLNPAYVEGSGPINPDSEFFPCSWLRRIFGDDFVSQIDAVYLPRSHDLPTIPSDTTRRTFELLQGCKRLRTLDTEGNVINGADLQKLPFIESLRELSLATRPDEIGVLLADDDLMVLERAINLRQLDLNRQNIGVDGIKHVRNCRQLQELDLSGTKVEDKGMQYLQDLNHLRHLRLKGLAIGGAGLTDIGFKPELKYLDLSETKIADDDLEHLAQFPNLEDISLTGTRITDKGFCKLKLPSRLNAIDLADTDVTDAAIEHLEGLPNLDHVNVQGTLVTLAAINRLKTNRPNCQIWYSYP